MNVFAGGRRIAACLVGITAMATIGLALSMQTTTATVYYQTSGPHTPFVRQAQPCDENTQYGDYLDSKDVDVGGGLTANVVFCFNKVIENGAPIVPLDPAYDADYEYEAARTNSWMLPVQDRLAAHTIVQNETDTTNRRTYRNVLLGGVSVASIILLIALTLGWLVRGFAGIPFQQDHVDAPTTNAHTRTAFVLVGLAVVGIGLFAWSPATKNETSGAQSPRAIPQAMHISPPPPAESPPPPPGFTVDTPASAPVTAGPAASSPHLDAADKKILLEDACYEGDTKACKKAGVNPFDQFDSNHAASPPPATQTVSENAVFDPSGHLVGYTDANGHIVYAH